MSETGAEERELLRRSARAFLADRAPSSALAASEQAPGVDRERWRAIAELGWLEAAVPGERGRLGAVVAPLVEEAGAALFPDPLVAVLALVHALGSTEDRLGLVPDLAAGARVVVPALVAEPGTLLREGDRLSGKLDFVESALGADALLIGPLDGAWRLVETTAPGVELRPMTAMVGGRWAVLELRSAASSAAVEAPHLVEIGAALQATFAAGAAAALLDATVRYVCERRQFGRPIGSFQALQHSLASAAIAADQAAALARRAVAAVEAPAAAASLYASSLAFVAATDRFVDVARRCHQAWGGMGFSTETDVHHFSRRARLMTQSWGGRDRHLDAIARERLASTLLRDRYPNGEAAR